MYSRNLVCDLLTICVIYNTMLFIGIIVMDTFSKFDYKTSCSKKIIIISAKMMGPIHLRAPTWGNLGNMMFTESKHAFQGILLFLEIHSLPGQCNFFSIHPIPLAFPLASSLEYILALFVQQHLIYKWHCKGYYWSCLQNVEKLSNWAEANGLLQTANKTYS